MKKSCDWHLIKMGFCVFLFINFLIRFIMKNINHFNLNILTVLPLLTCWFFQNVWFLAPILSFHIYFLEISVMLLPWSWSLKEKLKALPSNYNLLEEAKNILSGLEMISKAISKIIFWLFTLILVATIICTYLNGCVLFEPRGIYSTSHFYHSWIWRNSQSLHQVCL